MKKIIFAVLAIVFMFNLSSISQTKTKEKVVKFTIHTDLGDMTGILYNETPQHRDNFVKLVKAGYYDGTLFHRVIVGFMIQGGDPDSKNAKPGQALGMGGPSNPQKASSGSQFYIVQPENGTHFLDNDYTVFGEITEGLTVIDKIAAVEKNQADRPVKDVKMTIKIVE